MRREEFMWQLETLLADISEEEKQEALSYYRSYFEDAGEENEERILRELESPEKVAATIKADLRMEQGTEAGAYTEHGFEDGRFQDRKQELSQRTVDAGSYQQETSEGYQQGTGGYQQGTGGYQQGPGGYQQGTGGYQQGTAGNYGEGRSREEDRVVKIVVIAIAAVLTSPIWGGILLGILGTIFGLAVAFVMTAFSLYVCGGVLFGVGIGQLAVGSIAVGFGLLGASMFVLGLAILLTILCVWICGKGVPWLCGLIGKLWRKVFPGKEQA